MKESSMSDEMQKSEQLVYGCRLVFLWNSIVVNAIAEGVVDYMAASTGGAVEDLAGAEGKASHRVVFKSLVVDCRVSLPRSNSLYNFSTFITTYDARAALAKSVQSRAEAAASSDADNVYVGADDMTVLVSESTQDGFFTLDDDADSALGFEEFDAAQKKLGLHYPTDVATTVFGYMDLNANGALSADEYFLQGYQDGAQYGAVTFS